MRDKTDELVILHSLCIKGNGNRTLIKRKKFEGWLDEKLSVVRKWLNDAKYEDEHGLAGTGEKVCVSEWFWQWIKIYKEGVVKDNTEKFLEYCKGCMYYNAYVLFLQTGLRPGELGGLKWEDINLEKKELHVERTLLMRLLRLRWGFMYMKHTKKNTVKLEN